MITRHYYCSNTFQKSVAITLPDLWKNYYAQALFFLQDHKSSILDKESVDGMINQAPRLMESADKRVAVEMKFKETQISFNGIPRIRENRWGNLIECLDASLAFPNTYLRIDYNLVNELLIMLKPVDPGILYRALTHEYKDIFFDESLFPVLQSGNHIPLQQEIDGLGVKLESDSIYQKV